jgi:hypothetical protein
VRIRRGYGVVRVRRRSCNQENGAEMPGIALMRAGGGHGALMAMTVLNNPRAVAIGVYVIRAFVRPRWVFRAARTFCTLHSPFFILIRPLRNHPNPKSAST